MTEAQHTKALALELEKLGCQVLPMVASMLQRNLPDRYVLTASGRHCWLECKVWDRKTIPLQIDWLPLFGDRKRAGQDEMMRSLYSRAPDDAGVLVFHTDPTMWAVYVPGKRPDYILKLQGKETIIQWICPPKKC